MSTPGERLREERLRLGLSQEQFGLRGGVRKQAQIKYEKGDRKPDSSYLEGIAVAGADVDYILTGTPRALREKLNDIRTANELGVALGGNKDEIRSTAESMFSALGKARTDNAEEQLLLDNYRACTVEDKDQIIKLAQRLAPAEQKPKTNRKSK